MRCTCSMMPSNVRIIKVGGSDVGIVDLEKIIREVYFLKIEDEAAVREKLLEKIKANNFIPADRQNLYSEALLREYGSYVETRRRGKKVSPQPARQSSAGFLNFLRSLARGNQGKK